MIVLSLFDGISCGQEALSRIGISPEIYYTSEIDRFARCVTATRYPRTVSLGDVRNVCGNNLPKIDLLLAGSPCQGFSSSGKKLGLKDPRSALFFEFVRILEECDPRYFLLENTKMHQEDVDTLSRYVGTRPVEIDSALVSAQCRKRLYWTNIPRIDKLKDKGIALSDILEYGFTLDKKANTLTTRNYAWVNSERLSGTQVHVYNNDGSIRYFTPIECERQQTLPDNYTYIPHVSTDAKRYAALGNCWTVDVISWLLQFLGEKR
jgi:site-specific DNA-cytosine methylase